MTVNGVILDYSDTLVVPHTGKAVQGAVEAIDRLQAMGVQIIVVANRPSRTTIGRNLVNNGISVDHIVTKQEVRINKGSPRWMDFIKQETGLRTNQLFYIGDSDHDMWTASHAKVIYAHAAWANPNHQYGLPAPSISWIPVVVQHIFRKQYLWHWTFDYVDRNGHRVRKMALIDGDGAGDNSLKIDLLNLLKDEGNPKVGQMSLRDFVMLHLIASMYEGELCEESGWWTTYPGRTGRPNVVMGNFLDVAAKLFRRQYKGDLLLRHRQAMKSKDAYDRGGMPGAIDNQLTTICLNSNLAKGLRGKSVLLVDNFLTRGPTVEVGRNLLLSGGATDVTVVAVGKYGGVNHVITPPMAQFNNWDPFNTICPMKGADWTSISIAGNINRSALAEFLVSYRAIRRETW